MIQVEKHKFFEEPRLDILRFAAEDIMTSSDWNGGMFPFSISEIEKPQ